VKNLGCKHNWTYSVVDLSTLNAGMCCLPERGNKPFSDNEMDSLGTDVFMNNNRLVQRRIDTLNGLQNRDCQQCWDKENVGAVSKRQADHGTFQEHFKSIGVEYKDNQIVKESDTHITHASRPELLEIIMGNHCNLKCVYCGPDNSSQWALEEYKQGRITKEHYESYKTKTSEKFDELFWEWFRNTASKTLETINIKGGEPLIMPEFYTLVEHLNKNANPESDYKLCIITNLNIPDNYYTKFLDSIPKLTSNQRLEVLISMDDIYKRAEYIRTNLEWDLFESNVHKLIQAVKDNNNVKLGFMVTMSSMNVTGISDFILWAKDVVLKYDKHIGLHYNQVSIPKVMSPTVLGKYGVKYIRNAIRNTRHWMSTVESYGKPGEYGNWFDFLNRLYGLQNELEVIEPETTLLKMLRDRLDYFDDVRRLDWKSSIPELLPILDGTDTIESSMFALPKQNWLIDTPGERVYHKVETHEPTTEEIGAYCLEASRSMYYDGVTGDLRPCEVSLFGKDEVTSVEQLTNIRKRIVSGEKIDFCKVCRVNESTLGTSHRLNRNMDWVMPYNGNTHTGLIISNDCDAACLWCKPKESSTWQHIAETETLPSKLQHFTEDLKHIDPKPFEDRVKIIKDMVKQIAEDHTLGACLGIYGGEVLPNIIEEDHLGIICDTFYEHNKLRYRSLRVDIKTNLNVSLDRLKDVLDYVKAYKEKYELLHVVFQIKMSGSGDMYNYLHTGCDFQLFDNNLRYLMSQYTHSDTGKINFDHEIEFWNVTTNVSVAGMLPMYRYVKSLIEEYGNTNISFRMRIIGSNGLETNMLDESFLYHIEDVTTYLKENYTEEQYHPLINKLHEIANSIKRPAAVTTDLYQYKDLFDWFDKQHGTDLSKVNPEFYDYLVKISEK